MTRTSLYLRVRRRKNDKSLLIFRIESLVNMIDFHAHLLPGLDDGAAFPDESLLMARRAVAGGITAVLLTPHYIQFRYHNTRRRVLEHTGTLRAQLDRAGIPLAVFPAVEAQLFPGLPELIRKGEVLTVNDQGRHILVELPFLGQLAEMEKVLEEILLLGIRPVIAHPERHRGVQREPGWLAGLEEKGMLVQLNAGSLCGEYGEAERKLACQLIKLGRVHFIGSDAHCAYRRPLSLAGALEWMRAHLAPEIQRLILQVNPQAVLAGREIPDRRRAVVPPAGNMQ
ncbi:tyrosine-protein phosphatase [Desulfotomaculum copahuensis]|uniref:protein-tyrosine-phosphatase n=1 Tax=Desulfotomaculum copahuensis TaxID=1838280 RepID=A0A1B7LGW0_9FIRM|nr:CpsB/CapC family capsule biosynthesis tyrosine phosphatase [Desulfotomaculum copahuensis]OAT85288.1 hypothetical protein A6M21_07040 [Desulfotomaculum copahuensis]